MLHRQHPGKYVTHYTGTAREIFDNNPHITPGDGGGNARIIETQYPLINHSNERPVHFIQGYVEHLSRQLGVRLELTVNHPVLYLSDQEKGWTNQVKEVFAYYDKLIYPGQKVLGEVDPERMTKLQDFYLAKGIIQKKSPVEDLFTNQFVS